MKATAPPFTKRAIVLCALMLLALAGALLIHGSPPAGAGIGPGGYAQIARQALQHAGAPYGYSVRCTGTYSHPQTAQVKVTCVLSEKP